MDETYRMLGREHEADLDREAESRRLAREARGQRDADPATPDPDGSRTSRRITLATLRPPSLVRRPRSPEPEAD